MKNINKKNIQNIECTVADISAKAYYLTENTTGISWKDRNSQSMVQLCRFYGYDENEFHNMVIVWCVLHCFDQKFLVEENGHHLRVEEIYSAMVNWALTVKNADGEDFSEGEYTEILRFIDLLDEVDDGRMIAYLISALTREGYTVFIVPLSFFTTAMVAHTALKQ